MSVKKLRILIADDHTLVRHGARDVLHSRRGWKVVGEAANGRDAVEKTIKLKPDVAILDISMPELDGIEVVRQVREAVPATKLLVLTMHESDQMLQRAFDAGAHGFILKSDLTASLLKAVSAVVSGKRFLTPKISEMVLEGFLNRSQPNRRTEHAGTQATPRELEIIRLLTQGKSNKQVASDLAIAVRT